MIDVRHRESAHRPVNRALLRFFARHGRPGVVGIIGTNDPIGLAIRQAQRRLTLGGRPSLWSHCFVFGARRPDLHGPGRTRTHSPYIFESDLNWDVANRQLRNGAQESWVGKWCKPTVEHAAVIDFGLRGPALATALATALQLVDEQILYPVDALIGTWLAIVTRRQWRANPLKGPHSLYCSAFVRYCYRAAQQDFLGRGISLANTTPEDIARAGIERDALTFFQ